MTPFPPPVPDDRQPGPTESSEPSGSTGSRRTLTVVAFAVVALGVGGVIAGSQLVAAAADDSGNDTTDEVDTDDTGEPADEAGDGSTDDTAPSGLDDLTDIFDLDEGDLGELLDLGGIDLGGIDLGGIGTAFEEFDECIANELPDLEQQVDDVFGDLEDVFGDLPANGEWDAALEDLLGDSVTVFDADSDELLTVLDFGDGDGSITITRTDGEIEISTSGDVEEIDDALSFEVPDFELPEFQPDPAFEEALEECGALLPDGGLFDMVEDVLGDE